MLKKSTLLLMLLVVPAAALAQTNYDTAPNKQTGQQVYGSYFGSDVDSVNLFNGNLGVTIPLFSVSGRELPVGVSVSYNSGKWEMAGCGYDWCGYYTGGWKTAAPFSDTLSFFAEYDSCITGTWVKRYRMNAYWIDGRGTKHRYMAYADSAYAGNNCVNFVYPPSFLGLTLPSLDSDGSSIYVSNGSSTWTNLKFRDGTRRYFYSPYHPGSPPDYHLVTPNGNYLVEGSNGMPTQDTLGRTITYACIADCSGGGPKYRYTLTDSNGSAQYYTIQMASVTAWDPGMQEDHDITVTSWIELPNGKRWNFEYNHTQKFLTKLIFPSGGYVRYTYPSTETSATNNYVTSRIVSATGTSGGEKTWSYSGINSSTGAKTVTVTNPEGDKVRHVLSAQGTETQTQWLSSSDVVVKTETITWEQSAIEANAQPNNPKVKATTTFHEGGMQSKKVITYDSDNYPTQEKVYDWGGEPGTLVLQKDITYTTIAGAFKKVATETLSAINPANSTFEAQGKTEYFYDDYSVTDRGTSVPNHTHNTISSDRGNLTRARAYKDASNYTETQMKYDNLGNLIETIDPLSHSTTVDFTDNFTDNTNRYTFALPKKATNALGQYSTSKYNYATGLVKEITNVRGYTTTTVYDVMSRVTSVTEPNGKVTTYGYDDTNRITTKEVTVDTSSNKGRVKTYFDGLYRVTQTRTNDPDGEYAVDTEYDGNNRVKKTSNPYRLSSESPVWTQTAYDAASRPATVTAPDSSTVQYGYVNNITTTTDQAGNQRRYTYNILGQLTKVEEPSPSLATPAVTTYNYYGFGPLYQSSQSSQTRTWVYNWLGQMTSQTLPESGTTTFTYDSAGRLSTKTDARSVVTTMAYDNADRLTQRSYSDGTPTVGFMYDQSSQTGLRTAMTDGVGSVTYTYDTVDRLTQESRTLSNVSGTFSTSYVYNVKGDVTQMTYPSGRVVNFGYATGGGCCNSRLSSVGDGTTSVTLLNSIAFSAAGGVTSQTLNPGSNAISESFTYNNRLQLTQVQATKGSAAIMDFSYNYGSSSTNTGRVLSRTDATQSEHSATYVYDSLYRLTQAVGANSSWSVAWALDTWGNRTSQTPLGLATSKVGSQTLGYSNNKNTSFTYDSAGNTTNDTVHTYAYNAENQQTSMDGGTATYAYDGEGRRMRKYTSSETTYSFYGPGGLLCEFTTTSTGATAASSTDKTIYRTSEKTGSAVLLFNTSGLVIENNRTLPYGEAWLSDVASANDKKFTTYDRDKESGLDYAMNRMYASIGGRMTSPDQGPIHPGMPVTLNRYVYGGNDPINHTDVTGNDWIDDLLSPWNQHPVEIYQWLTICMQAGEAYSPACPGYGDMVYEMMLEYQGNLQQAYADRFAGASGAVPNGPDSDCIRNKIATAATQAGLMVAPDMRSSVSIAGQNGVRNTELNLSGSSSQIQSLIDQMCTMGWANNNQCPGGVGNDLLVGEPHEGYDGNFRAPGLTNSVQVNTKIDLQSGLGSAQIDVDPYNPTGGLLGTILHIFGQVVWNGITGGDTDYGCPK